MSKAVKKIFDFTKEHSLLTAEGRDKLTPEGPPEAKVAPDPDSLEAAKAESRKRQRKTRTGRTSTVLTPGGTLG